jgi:hypothetical protein
MLVALIAIFGFAVSLADGRLDRVLPAVTATPWPVVVAYTAVVAFGTLLVLPLAVGLYLFGETCGCGQPPVAMGMALLVTGGATLAWWAMRAGGIREPPASLAIVGGVALAAAVVFGLLRLGEDVGRIVTR